jgi:hypothetical protein
MLYICYICTPSLQSCFSQLALAGTHTGKLVTSDARAFSFYRTGARGSLVVKALEHWLLIVNALKRRYKLCNLKSI